MKKILLMFSVAALFVAIKNIPTYASNFSYSFYSFGNGDGYMLKKESIADNVRKVIGESTSADFKITGDASGSAYVEVYAKSNNNKHLSQTEIQKILDDKYILEISQANGELKLTAKKKSSFGWNWNNSDNINILFNVHIPSNIATVINTTSGDVQLYDLKGDQYFKGTSGDIIAERIQGNLEIATTSGDAKLSHIAGKTFSCTAASGDVSMESGQYENIRSNTASGDVVLNNVSGNTNVSSASGDIRIRLNEGSLIAKSASGDQHIEIKNPKDYVRASAASGDVNITVPASIGADVNLSGSSVSMSSRDKFSGSFSKDKSAVGKWNGGGIPLEIKTGSGDIRLDWN
ncbi:MULTISPECIES: DUF4097 family beta strand repeat-containing protein [Chitinophagaceae]